MNPNHHSTYEQAHKLQFLGLPYYKAGYPVEVWSVAMLLDLLPPNIGRFDLHIDKYQNTEEPITWQIEYYSTNMGGEYNDSLIRIENECLAWAAADMLIWLIEEGRYQTFKT